MLAAITRALRASQRAVIRGRYGSVRLRAFPPEFHWYGEAAGLVNPVTRRALEVQVEMSVNRAMQAAQLPASARIARSVARLGSGSAQGYPRNDEAKYETAELEPTHDYSTYTFLQPAEEQFTLEELFLEADLPGDQGDIAESDAATRGSDVPETTPHPAETIPSQASPISASLVDTQVVLEAQPISFSLPAFSIPGVPLNARFSFEGSVELRAGSDSASRIITIHRDRIELEMQRVITESVSVTIRTQLSLQQAEFVRRVAEALSGDQSASGLELLRLFLEAINEIVTVALNMGDTEVQVVADPDLYIVRVEGTWPQREFDAILFGVPVVFVLVGRPRIELRPKIPYWAEIMAILRRRIGRYIVNQIVKRLLSRLFPAWAIVGGTVVGTFAATYFSAYVVGRARTSGIIRGLANQYATAYVRRVYYPDRPAEWWRGFTEVEGLRREAREAGLATAEQDLLMMGQESVRAWLEEAVWDRVVTERHARSNLIRIIDWFGEYVFRGAPARLGERY